MKYTQRILKAKITKENFAGEIGDIIYVIKSGGTIISSDDVEWNDPTCVTLKGNGEMYDRFSARFKPNSYFVLENETNETYWGEYFYLLQSDKIEILN